VALSFGVVLVLVVPHATNHGAATQTTSRILADIAMKTTSTRAKVAVGIIVMGVLSVGCSSGSQRQGSQYAAAPPGPNNFRHAEIYSPRSGQRGSAFLFLPGSPVQQLVSFQVIDGIAVRGGDIMLGPLAQLPFLYGTPRLGNPNIHTAVASSKPSHLWPNGDIPYVIDSSVTQEKRGFISWAISRINQTELNVRPRTAADADKDSA